MLYFLMLNENVLGRIKKLQLTKQDRHVGYGNKWEKILMWLLLTQFVKT